MSRVELKTSAKSQISGKILILFVIAIVEAVIIGALSLIPFVGTIAGSLLTFVFSLSFCIIYLKLTKSEGIEVKDLFSGFSNAINAILLGILQAIFVFLWSLLFVIPGIIKSYAYSMSTFVLAENPDMSATDALKKSQEIMDGHKMEYFILQLSFIPWYLLVGITFGIAGLYVGPYVNATTANFYNAIKGE